MQVKYDHDNLAYFTQRGASTIYLAYGPDNQRTRQWGADGSKVYVDGYEDWLSAGSSKVYIGGDAVITTTASTRSVNYLLTDRLGSVDSVADSTGALVETRGSDAFGKPRSGTWADASPARLQSIAITEHGFTGHEHLNSVELIHMNGRVYDYALGRFLSVDPFIQFPLNSQSLNPYSYILNNPLAGTDPSGYCSVSKPGSQICDFKAEKAEKESGGTTTTGMPGSGQTAGTGQKNSNGATNGQSPTSPRVSVPTAATPKTTNSVAGEVGDSTASPAHGKTGDGYYCQGGPGDCPKIDKYVGLISKALNNPKLKADDHALLEPVVKFLGKPGTLDKNSVIITPRALGKNIGGNADVGFIEIDPAKVTSPADGAGTIGHEVSHEIDIGRRGLPTTRQEEHETEVKAYQVQGAIARGLGVDLGVSTQQDVETMANKSTERWCVEPGNTACH